MRIILVALTILYLSVAGCGQTGRSPAPNQNPEGQSITGPGITGLPLRQRFTPKITMQASLKLAEGYLKKEKINLSTHYLSEARMIWYVGEKGMKEPHWLFVWAHEDGVPVLSIQIVVSMNGKVTRLPLPYGASHNSFNRSGKS